MSAGQVLVGMAAAQLCGEDFLVGLDRPRADTAGQALTPVPGSASTTAAGSARVLRRAVGGGADRARRGTRTALDLLAGVAPDRRERCATDRVTIDLDTTDVEVYGRSKQGVAFNHRPASRSPHVAAWADTATVPAADLGACCDDPRATCAELAGRALAAPPAPARAGRIRLRADAGYFAGWLARAGRLARACLVHRCGVRDRGPAHRAAVRILDGVPADRWADAIDMTAAQVGWPSTARTGGPRRPGC